MQPLVLQGLVVAVVLLRLVQRPQDTILLVAARLQVNLRLEIRCPLSVVACVVVDSRRVGFLRLGTLHLLRLDLHLDLHLGLHLGLRLALRLDLRVVSRLVAFLVALSEA